MLTAIACPPAASIAATCSASLSARRAASTTFAPAAASALAKPAPNPDEAPVTSATRPGQIELRLLRHHDPFP
jgi:hypothetical protein